MKVPPTRLAGLHSAREAYVIGSEIIVRGYAMAGDGLNMSRAERIGDFDGNGEGYIASPSNPTHRRKSYLDSTSADE